MNVDMNELELKVAGWGLARNITEEGGVTAHDQVSKLIEELAECVSTLGKIEKTKQRINELYIVIENGEADKSDIQEYETLQDVRLPLLEDKLKDDYGDMRVCIIQAERLSGTNGQETLTKAWGDIKDRKGKMIDGKFVKESDLNEKLFKAGEESW